MKTKIIKVEDKTSLGIVEGKNLIQKGELVAFPTETVYGLGADGLNPEAVKKIFIAKGRPQDNPLILHISDTEMLQEIVSGDISKAKILMEKFWPGPLTIIFNKSKKVPDIITGGLETVAVRMPDNEVALELIKQSKTPIAAPSANISGRPSPTDALTCYEDLEGKIELILDGGNTQFGLESTVVDMTGENPIILRPGAVTLEMLKEIYPETQLDKGIIEIGQVPKSPGQKYKHYAPKAEAYLLDGSNLEKKEKLEKFLSENKDKKIGLMATTEFLNSLENFKGITKDLGSKEDLKKVGSLIFRDLRELDKEKVDIIICESVKNTGIGVAIINRLKKSTSNRFIGEEK